MNECEKVAALKRLAARRARIKIPGYRQPEEFHGYDFRDFVSPITKGASNVCARYFFVLQDWSSEAKLSLQGHHPRVAELGRDPDLRTNLKLADLSKSVELTFADIYITNAFPLIKAGSISAAVPRSLVRRTAKSFMRREIQIVGPKQVIALGRVASDALHYIGVAHAHVPHPAIWWISDERMRELWRERINQG